MKALVYVASFLLEVGESTGDLAGKYPGNELGAALRPVPVRDPDGQTVDDLYIQQDTFRAERASSHAVEVDASHAVTVSRPDVVARVIDEAAGATSA